MQHQLSCTTVQPAFTGAGWVRLAPGRAGAMRALARAAPTPCKTQHPLNKSLQGLLSLCFRSVME